MSGLANWIMKKRSNAIILVAVCSIIPFMIWLSTAALGLVVLRKGVKNGISVLAWGGLSALVLWAIQSEASALIVLINGFILAYLLRETRSWSWVVLGASVLAVIGSLLVPIVMSQPLGLLTDAFYGALENQGQLDGYTKSDVAQELVISLSVAQAYMAVAALLLARKWQASLDNPGGLRKEFHQLRLPLMFTSILVAMVLVGESLGGAFGILSAAAIPALIIPGLALVHGILAIKKIGMFGLVPFYMIGVFILNVYFVYILAFLAVVDSFVNIRGRIASKPTDVN